MSTRPAIEPTARERRDFLGKLGKGLGILAGIELLAVVVAYLAPGRSVSARGAGLVSAGPVGEFTPASVRAFPGGKFYLVRLADGGFLALSSRCTHLGCMVPWNEERRAFPCPCHASTFDERGDVLAPPATRPLDLYPVVIEAGIVKVDTSRPIQRARFEPGQVTYL